MNVHFIVFLIGCVAIGWVIGGGPVWVLLARRRRKALVAASLDVINNYRRFCNHPYPLSQFEERCQTAVVMNRLIDATKYVN